MTNRWRPPPVAPGAARRKLLLDRLQMATSGTLAFIAFGGAALLVVNLVGNTVPWPKLRTATPPGDTTTGSSAADAHPIPTPPGSEEARPRSTPADGPRADRKPSA